MCQIVFKALIWKWLKAETKFQKITSLSNFEKVAVQKSIEELWTVISNYQLPHTQFGQINDHKHDIYLYGKLFTKLLGQAANKNTKFMFTKTGLLLFLRYDFRSDRPIRSADLLNQKHNVGWFLLRRFVDLVRVYSLQSISRNHSKMFLLTDLQKLKTCLK